MLTTVYFVRHGEAYNPDPVKYVTYPGFHLTERGKKEAKKVAEFFKNRSISAIYSSPFYRTKETAEIIASEFGKEVIIEDSIKELPYGSVEPADKVAARIRSFLRRVIKNHLGGNVVIVTHQGVIDSISSYLLEGKPVYPYKGGAGLTSISEFELDADLEVSHSNYLDVDPST